MKGFRVGQAYSFNTYGEIMKCDYKCWNCLPEISVLGEKRFIVTAIGENDVTILEKVRRN